MYYTYIEVKYAPRYFYKVLVLDLIIAPNVTLEGIQFKVPCGETIWWIFVLYSHALKVNAEILKMHFKCGQQI